MYFQVILLTICLTPSIFGLIEDFDPFCNRSYVQKEFYCNQNAHPLCQKHSGKGSKCITNMFGIPSMKLEPLTDDSWDQILDDLNNVRNFMAMGQGPIPPATTMMELTTSMDLLVMASQYVSRCTTEQAAPREAGVITFQANAEQNLTWTDAIRAWANEALLLNPKYIVPYVWEPQSSNVAQLLWWNSRHVGCAKADYTEKDSNQEKSLFACLFKVKGNKEASVVYKMGNTASGCAEKGLKVSSKYQGLCEYPSSAPGYIQSNFVLQCN